MYAKTEVIHYPNLKTVLMVEEILKKADVAISRAEIKRRLPKEMMHQTLNIVLAYLEERGMILDSRKGIVWTYNPSSKFQAALTKGVKVK